MRKLLDRYYGRLRKVKVNYVLLNLLNRKKLGHTKRMYQRYGIDRSPILPVSSENMPEDRGEIPWLDRPDASAALSRSTTINSFSSDTQQAIKAWPDNGYLILRNCFSKEEVAAINAEVDRMIEEKVVDYNFTGRKIMFAFKHSEMLREIVHDKRITEVIDFLLGREVAPFQSINFMTGSEQHAHSDSIHMTTYPLGNLAAAWIALENIHPDNGPLEYYPGSHKLPYLLNDSYDHGGDTLTIGEDAYARYEEAVASGIKNSGLAPVVLQAEPGDVLIWHANLIHGGKKMSSPNASRKSMAIHYFAKDVVCYHELTQRAALMEEETD